MMGFGEAISMTQSMNNGAEIERVGAVVLKTTEVIDKAKSCVDIAVSCAEVVDFFGPVGGVGYVNKVVVVVVLLCVK